MEREGGESISVRLMLPPYNNNGTIISLLL